ncbi:hypothetical protein RHMOL_Rhmol06G0129500 [Rhododendron molle]|uniref:Uncharacterized protein n=1 Tax=Rhododendron molle TaxID=49168 RepID=A0ACC0NC02_RHOML|nr:hypothetical protein RHMOL_Rhmol06G0129500 [Rhododendron molle]
MTATLIDFYINVVALSHHYMHLYCPTAIPSLISRSCLSHSPKKQQQASLKQLAVFQIYIASISNNI